MSPRLKFAVALIACSLTVAATVSAVLAVLWSRLDAGQQVLLAAELGDSVGLLLFLSALLVAALALAVQAIIRAYVLEPRRMADQVRLMAAADAANRLTCSGPVELQELGNAINALADRRDELRREVEHKIAEAGGALERENSRLATVMSQLSESVVVCNTAGAILLYNHRAQRLLETPSDDAAVGEQDVVGLGRSLFSMLGPDVVAHARDHIQQRLQDGDHDAVSVFVARTRGGLLLRARMAPVTVPTAGGHAELWGYVLVLENIGRDFQMAGLREQLLTSLVENVRSALGGIRAAAETLLQHPGIDAAQRQRFLEIITAEAGKLGTRLESVAADHPGRAWTLPTMSGQDLLLALQRELEERLDVRVTLSEAGDARRIRADSYLLAQALAAFASNLRTHCGVRQLELRLQGDAPLPLLDVAWRGKLPDTDTVSAWITTPLPAAARLAETLSLTDIVELHGGTVWYTPDFSAGTGYLRLLLSETEMTEVLAATSRSSPRPVFYDFDLFHRPGQTQELDQCQLAELPYTVFDTETTGLEPSRGDEIVSIGAVRIVNGRLLPGETFHQLVDPRRSLPGVSVRIHGITAEMLRDQPTLDRVLPSFHRFCEDTVLVAHNAAFDMRFVQLGEQRAGVRFDNPVLDTLMLSFVLHPDQAEHSLEALATRFGVAMEGRHTALGDAVTTGGIFVKMLPLLRDRGILTLGQARAASEQTPYARVRY